MSRWPVLHEWDLSPRQAMALQSELRSRVQCAGGPPVVARVAGVDVGFEEHGRVTRAAVAVLTYPELTLRSHVIERRPTAFPYVPGLLSFRELPAVLAALDRLEPLPDLVLCDGQGYAHPRRFGLACHLGVWTGLPVIGVGKSRLIGVHGPVPPERPARVPLTDAGETIGAVLRSRTGVKPVFVSVGHRVDLEAAVTWTLRCTGRFRLPEPIRWAHRLASGR